MATKIEELSSKAIPSGVSPDKIAAVFPLASPFELDMPQLGEGVFQCSDPSTSQVGLKLYASRALHYLELSRKGELGGDSELTKAELRYFELIYARITPYVSYKDDIKDPCFIQGIELHTQAAGIEILDAIERIDNSGKISDFRFPFRDFKTLAILRGCETNCDSAFRTGDSKRGELAFLITLGHLFVEQNADNDALNHLMKACDAQDKESVLKKLFDDPNKWGYQMIQQTLRIAREAATPIELR